MKLAVFVLTLAVCWHQSSAEVNALRQMMVDMSELGCFKAEAIANGVASESAQPGVMNKYWCIAKCVMQSMGYAALRNGTVCVCMNQYSSENEAGDQSYYADPATEPCNVPCAGKPSQEPNCGGEHTYLIMSTGDYLKPANDFMEADSKTMADQYFHCYGDFQTGSQHDLRHSTIRGSSMQVSVCFSHCMYEGFKYALLSNGDTCSCSDTEGHLGEAQSDSSCSDKCVGNTEEMCGAATFMSAYHVPSGTYQIQVLSEGGPPAAPQLTTAGNATLFWVNGKAIGFKNGERGIHAAILKRSTGELIGSVQNYDTFMSTQAAENFDMFIHRYVGEDTIILVSILDDAAVKCLQTDHGCFPYLQEFGATSNTEAIGIRDSFAFIGYNGTTCEYYRHEIVEEAYSPSVNGKAPIVQATSFIPYTCFGLPNVDSQNRPAYLVEVRSEGGDAHVSILENNLPLFHVAGKDVNDETGRGLNFHVFDRTTRNVFATRWFDPYGVDYYNNPDKWNADLMDFYDEIPNDSVVLLSVMDDAAVSLSFYSTEVNDALFDLGKVNGFDFRDSYCLIGYKGDVCGSSTDLRRAYGPMGWVTEKKSRYDSGNQLQSAPVTCRARIPSNTGC